MLPSYLASIGAPTPLQFATASEIRIAVHGQHLHSC